MEHMQHAKSVAAGVAVPAGVEKSFAVTQATWRFFANDRVTPQALVEPLREFARQQLAQQQLARQQLVAINPYTSTADANTGVDDVTMVNTNAVVNAVAVS